MKHDQQSFNSDKSAHTALDLCNALGRAAIAARVGRSKSAVSNAAAQGVLPAAWFAVVRQMCEDAGIADCPLSAFAFVQPVCGVSSSDRRAA